MIVFYKLYYMHCTRYIVLYDCTLCIVIISDQSYAVYQTLALLSVKTSNSPWFLYSVSIVSSKESKRTFLTPELNLYIHLHIQPSYLLKLRLYTKKLALSLNWNSGVSKVSSKESKRTFLTPDTFFKQ